MMNFNEQSRSCHAERSEASRCPLRQILRGVYPERSEWAQDDKTLPILVVNDHNTFDMTTCLLIAYPEKGEFVMGLVSRFG